MMKMTRILMVVGCCSVIAASAEAGILTSGVWVSAALPAHNGAQFWDGASRDGVACNIGDMLMTTAPNCAGLDVRTPLALGLTGLEFLTDGANGPAAFTFTDAYPLTVLETQMTLWLGGELTWEPGGALHFDAHTTDHARTSTSTSVGQMALFRRAMAAGTAYYVGIEDMILVFDPEHDDFQDLVASVYVENPPQRVPEPSTLTLTGLGAAGLVVRRRYAR